MAESPTSVREAIGAAVAPYLVDGQEQDIGIADAVIDTLASLPLTVILDTLGIEYRAIEQNCVLMAFDEHGNGVDSWDNSVLIVDIRATDEAHDG